VGAFVYNLRMPGQVYDQETGLFYNYYRDYDPATGRYGESDPIGLEGGINTYGYGDQNPASLVDPFGLTGIALPLASSLAKPGFGTLARPGFGTLVDPMVTPSVNPNDPNNGGESEKCRQLRKKIDNLKKEVFDKRIPDLEANPQQLPQRIGPGEKLSETIRGHEKLLNRQWKRLNELEDKYFKECGC
jgi:RHS repeat-associated protein